MADEARFGELLRSHFGPLNQISDKQVERLAAHCRLMLRWNRVLSLTSIRDLEECVVRHYCEALFLALHLPPGSFTALDVGSGAGFPGVPIAVFRPEYEVALAESNRRKAVFLREATRGYGNVRVIAGRAEDAGEFDWVVSRAVRWQDVLRVEGRAYALLVGAEDGGAMLSSAGVSWRKPIRLPWGERRVLVVGERNVPRET